MSDHISENLTGHQEWNKAKFQQTDQGVTEVHGYI